MGFSRDGRSEAKGDRKNTRVEKYTKGCHGNLKSLISSQILPEKAPIQVRQLSPLPFLNLFQRNRARLTSSGQGV